MNIDNYDKYSKYRRLDEDNSPDDNYDARKSSARYNYDARRRRMASDNSRRDFYDDYYEYGSKRRRKKSYAPLVAAFLIIIVVIFVCVAAYVYIPKLKEAASSYFSDVFDSGYDELLDAINDEISNGIDELIDENAVASLEDSGITGEGYSFDVDMYPYYGFLGSSAKAVYRQICANVENYETTFVPVESISGSDLEDAVLAVFCDHPEYIWLDNSYSYRYTADGTIVQISLTFNGLINDISSARSSFESAANSIISATSGQLSDYDKEVYVHDALLSVCSYNEGASYNQSAYSALVLGESVCAGYARSFQYMMQQLNIPTYYCIGTAEGGDHGWDIVHLSDGYYNVDATWDDTVNDAYGYAYAFFNMPDTSFLQTHSRTDMSVNLPACSGTAYYTPSEYGVVAP